MREVMKLNRHNLFFLLDWIFRLLQLFFGLVDGFSNLYIFLSYKYDITFYTPENARSSILIGGLRPAQLYIPSTYNSSIKTPLVIGMHGIGSNGYQAGNYLKL